MAGTITISSNSITSQQGVKVIGPLLVTAANPIGAIVDSAFPAAQTNTIPVPTGATAVVIVPPTSTTTTFTLKGIAGDTGIVMAAGLPAVVPLAAATTNIVLTSSAGIGTGNVELTFV